MRSFNANRVKHKQKYNEQGLTATDRPNRAWKTVEGYLKECVAIGFVVAAASVLMTHHGVVWPRALLHSICSFLDVRLVPDDNAITYFTFFVLADLIVVPIYTARSLYQFVGTGIHLITELSLRNRMTYTFGALFIGIGALVTPIGILLSDPEHSGRRVRGFYDLASTSYIGLSLVGGVITWVSVVGILALAALPLFWSRN